MSLNIVFAGTPEFAALILTDLLHSQHKVSAVYTQPDRPSGRGQHLSESAVKKIARAHQLPVYQPVDFKQKSTVTALRALKPDVMVVAAYGLLLPEALLTIPKFGCINVHASLLPRYRGAAPIQYAILHGDIQSGVTIMQMDQGLDTGDILLQRTCAIEDTDTVVDLENKLVSLGSQALLEVLNQVARGTLRRYPQDSAHASYAAKISHPETFLDWLQPAVKLSRKIRAFYPKPGTHAIIHDQLLKIHYATVLTDVPETLKSDALPGTVIAANKYGIDVATGQGVLRLLTLQFPSGRSLPVSDILNSKTALFTPGHRFLV